MRKYLDKEDSCRLPILSPDELLLDITDIHENDLEEFARQKYRELFIQSNGRGEHTLHDGEKVIFWETRFEHALYDAKEWQHSAVKDVLDKRRLERLAWVLPLLSGNMPTSECWMVTQGGRTKRFYVMPAKGFVVWLEPKSNGTWTFSTGYDVSPAYIYQRTRGGRRLWKK